uniref:Uncharacterized protein n=1 Tax=Leviviridae sp. TaxID=2027243 RepID=A0A514D7E4_9VIRU|nr:MAG: hypothetical protein H4Bulk461479_000002 [Leviviridae sp.]
MALSDPQTVTVATIAQTLARTSSGPDKGAFRKEDGSYALRVEHTYAKRTRHFARLDYRKVAPDPLMPSTNVPYNMGVYLVVDAPPVGFTNAELKFVVDGFLAYLNASSGAVVTKILGGES